MQALAIPAAFAATEKPALVVLRNQETEQTHAEAKQVDDALIRALRQAGVTRLSFSPTPIEDVELLAECEGLPEESCMARVAATLGNQGVLVRRVKLAGDGEFEVTLTAFEAGSKGPSQTVRARLRGQDGTALEQRIQGLIAALYGYAQAPHAKTAEAPSRSRSQHPLLRGVGFGSLASSAAVLSAGLILGVQSYRAHDAYEATEVTDERSVDRAQRLLERSRTRASQANDCFVVGSAAAITGVGFLIWDLLIPERKDLSIALSVTPMTQGASLLLTGRLERRL